jgi:hypothetical protein
LIENRHLAGLVAGIPVSLACLAYVLLRRDTVVQVFTGGGKAMSTESASILAVVTAVLIGPVLGLAAALVFNRMPSEQQYATLAFGLATAMSLAALVSRTPLMVEKIVLNYLVAVCLGLIMPWLVAG